MATVRLEALELDDFREDLEERGISVAPTEDEHVFVFEAPYGVLEEMIEEFWGLDKHDGHQEFSLIQD